MRDKARWLIVCREMPEHFQSVWGIHRLHQIVPPSRCAALGRVTPELVGLPGKAKHGTPREGSGSLSMQPVGCTPWCSTDAHLNVVLSVRRLQGRTWTLAMDLLNDLNAIDCNIDDVINCSSCQFTRLVDSFNSNFHC